MNNSLVSIVIPVYNSEKYISRCLDSITNQTYDNLEIILINDGSTDNSIEICLDYKEKDKRIIVVNKSNGGVSSTRNQGIDCATGKYIQFVDSDDYINLDMTENLVYAIEKYDVDLVLCGVNHISSNTNDSDLYRNVGDFLLKDFLSNSLDSISSTSMGAVWNKLYKLSKIKDNKIRFEEDINYSEDCIFNYDYFKKSTSIYVLKDKLYNYDQSDLNALTKVFRKNAFMTTLYLYDKTIELMDTFLINVNDNIKKINQYYSNNLMVNVIHIYRHKGKLTSKERQSILIHAFKNEKVINIFKDKKFNKSVYSLIYSLIKKNRYHALNILMLFVNKAISIRNWFRSKYLVNTK